MKKSKSQEMFFSGLGNNARLRILQVLAEEEFMVSHLAKKLKISIQGTQKHLEQLRAIGLVERKWNHLSLTNLGRAVYKNVSSFQFLSKNAKFFHTHSLDFLPSKFIYRIGQLNNSELQYGFVNLLEKYKILYHESSAYAKLCVDQVAVELYKEAIPLFAKNGTHLSVIYSEDVDVPKGWQAARKQVKEAELIKNGKMEYRMVNKLNLQIYVSDKIASVMFPDMEGFTDVSKMFVSTDKQFREWCSDLFDYFLSKSYKFDEKKIHER